MEWAIVLAASYLLGSVPSGYLMGKLLLGIDIRHYGSGNIGGSNVWRTIGPWAGMVVVLTDMAKGAAAVALARWLELGTLGEVLAGLAAMAGHNWSLYLGFSGGRGVDTALGALVLLSWETVLLGAALWALLLVLTRDHPLSVFITALTLPAFALVVREPSTTVLGCAALVGVYLVRRLQGSAHPGPAGTPRSQVLLNRLLWDRDIRDREQWLSRRLGQSDRQETQRR